ncbi:MAG: polysaccharide biosynthesis tyrosine autokinase [Candidatus Omnitrophica bacterium]|nr:polysaccharide biosynthesis tyrosine autokinase [Candidatus Omnitrophota bacterium]
MATVAIGLKLKTPVFESQVKILISAEKQVEATYYRDLIGARNAEIVLTQSEIVISNPVIERAVQAMGLYERPLDYEKRFASALKKPLIDFQVKRLNKQLEPLSEEQRKAYSFRLAVEELKRNVRVEPIRDTNLFTISAREFSPIGAAIIANVVSRSYVIFDLEQQLAELELKYGAKHLSVMQMKDNIEKMRQSLNGEPLANVDAIGPASVKIIEQAQVPLRPVGPSELLTLLLALVMSPFLGIMLAFMFEYIDQTFKSPQDIETVLGLPYLGSIAKKKKLKAKGLHNLSDQIALLMKDKNLQSLLFSAALPREGATTIVANLAKRLAQKLGYKVLIIDANLRSPAMHKVFKIPESPGLAEVLEGKVAFEKAFQVIDRHLNVLTAGKSELNPATLLGSSMMSEIINMAKQKREIILLDCANFKDFQDAAVLAQLADGTAIVIKEGRTRRQVVKAAIAPLQAQKANLIGAILNNRTYAIPGFVYERV